MSRITFRFPPFAGERGSRFWLRPRNLLASRTKVFRFDDSNEWRQTFEGQYPDPGGPDVHDRAVPFSTLVGAPTAGGFRFIILGDTGEGDRSQYGLLPLIRHLRPHFMIINGDVAYPAGNVNDYAAGLFRPYANLHIPIWAVPGNHEYYSTHKGREFYEVFCTNTFEGTWNEHGLRFVRQPGTYWELSEPAARVPLVVLGVDSGQKADLDRDAIQLSWLERRLRAAQGAGRQVIVLFHIPGLRDGKHDGGTKLTTLHRMLLRYTCVRLVVCAHQHNFQLYDRATFARYAQEQYTAPVSPGAVAPWYIVSGAGGAALSASDFPDRPYATANRFPDPDQWRSYVGWIGRVFGGLRRSKLGLVRSTANVLEANLKDEDAAQFLSFLLVDVAAGGAVSVRPVWLKNLDQVFSHLPDGSVVQVDDPNPNLALTVVQNECLRNPLPL